MELGTSLVGSIGAGPGEVHSGVGGVQGSPWGQEPIPRHQHAVQHALPQQEVPHPLADDDVHLMQRSLTLISPSSFRPAQASVTVCIYQPWTRAFNTQHQTIVLL